MIDICRKGCVRFALLLALLACFGCATHHAHDEGIALMAQGQYEEGIAQLEEAVKEDPSNFKLRTDLIDLREQALNRLLLDAAQARSNGDFDNAAALYQRALRIEPSNARAKAGLSELDRDRSHAEIMRDANEALAKGNTEGAWARLREVLKEDPGNQQAIALKRQIEGQRARELASTPTLHSLYSGQPINLDFRDANLRQILEALSRETKISFIFDRDVKPDLRTTIVARQISFDDAVDLILMSNQLEMKVINSDTVLIYPSTPEKIQQYQDLVVKGFYLTYANVKQTAELFKTVIKPKEMFVDEDMSLIVIRDTPDAIRVAEKLVAMHDLAEPEVMLDLEVVEVQRNKLEQLGVQWPNQLTLAPLATNGQTTTLGSITGITGGTTSATLANMIINLDKEAGVIDLLANPRIRTQNHQKADILIGNKVPVITTTSTATGFASQSVQYLDVGLKLTVEPSIKLDDDVELKLALEVSSIISQVQIQGVLTYQIGTRNASTVLRMKDGETQILGGLISDQDTRTTSGVPGLADIPIVNRLFASHSDNHQKTEIVLLITPHLIRNVTLPDATTSEFLSGSEKTLRSPLQFAAASTENAPAANVEAPKDQTQPITLSGAGAGVAAAALNGVTLSWNGPQQVKVGDEFKVAVRVKADKPLKSIPLQLGFDAAALEVVDVAEGDFFKQAGAKSNFADTVDTASGHIFIGASRSGTDGVNGEGELAVITFKAKTPQPKSELKVTSVTGVGNAGNENVMIPSPLIVNIIK